MLGIRERMAGMRRRWDAAGAVRAEHCLEPTWRRRLDRLPQRVEDRWALHRERAARRRRIDGAAERAYSEAWMGRLPHERRSGRRDLL